MADQISYYEKGLDTLQALGWKPDRNNVSVNPHLDQAFWNHTIENLLGRVWGRDGLSMRDRQITVMGVLVALGSEFGIENHFRHCHAVGLSEVEVREIIMQAGYYSGWPRFAVINKRFNEILDEPGSSWPAAMRMKLPEPGAQPESDATDWYHVGLQTLNSLGWTKELTSVHPTDTKAFDQAFWNHTIENLWGRVWGRPGLSLRDRQIVVLATLITADSEVGIAGHFKNCHNVGLTEQQVREIIMQAGYYAGWPKFATATVRFNRALQDPASTWPEASRMKLPASGERPPV